MKYVNEIRTHLLGLICLLFCGGCASTPASLDPAAVKSESVVMQSAEVQSEPATDLEEENSLVVTYRSPTGDHLREHEMVRTTENAILWHLSPKPGRCCNMRGTLIMSRGGEVRFPDVSDSVRKRWAEVLLADEFPYKGPPLYTTMQRPPYDRDRPVTMAFRQWDYSNVAMLAIVDVLSEMKDRKGSEEIFLQALKFRLQNRLLEESEDDDRDSSVADALVHGLAKIGSADSLPLLKKITEEGSITGFFASEAVVIINARINADKAQGRNGTGKQLK